MGKISHALYEIHELDELSERNNRINQLHPLIKLLVTVIYTLCVISFDKYDIFGLLPMLIYPLILFRLADITIMSSLRKLRIVLVFIILFGIINPVFDHLWIYQVNGFIITGGMISMITLILKGLYTLTASYLLIATTGIDRICYALKLLHIPCLIVTQILFTYRYIAVLMGEANAVIEAYSLRAPKEKGIKYKVWGPLLGQLLFRSIDRAGNLYDSMLLRGYKGEFYYANPSKCTWPDYIYLFLWLIMFASLKVLNAGRFMGIY